MIYFKISAASPGENRTFQLIKLYCISSIKFVINSVILVCKSHKMLLVQLGLKCFEIFTPTPAHTICADSNFDLFYCPCTSLYTALHTCVHSLAIDCLALALLSEVYPLHMGRDLIWCST